MTDEPKRRGRGRPKKTAEKRAAAALNVRVREDQLAAYDEAAEAAGVNRSEWVVSRLDAAARRERARRS